MNGQLLNQLVKPVKKHKPKKNTSGYLTFEEAMFIAQRRRLAVMDDCKPETKKRVERCINLFMRDGFNPCLNWQSSVTAYLAKLAEQGQSKSYIRGVQSILKSLGECLPDYQAHMFGGD